MSPVPDCQPVLARTTLGDQLGDGFAMVDDGIQIGNRIENAIVAVLSQYGIHGIQIAN